MVLVLCVLACMALLRRDSALPYRMSEGSQ
jgi:hypothetical protein